MPGCQALCKDTATLGPKVIQLKGTSGLAGLVPLALLYFVLV